MHSKKELIKCFGRLAHSGVLTIEQQIDIMKKIESKSYEKKRIN